MQITFACCFCGLGIVDPQLQVVAGFKDEDDEMTGQTWWAHPHCLHNALHEYVRGDYHPSLDALINP